MSLPYICCRQDAAIAAQRERGVMEVGCINKLMTFFFLIFFIIYIHFFLVQPYIARNSIGKFCQIFKNILQKDS